MKKKILLTTSVLILGIGLSYAQPTQSQASVGKPDGGIMNDLDMNSVETSFVLNVNSMNEETREKLNRVAAQYRTRNRSILTDFGSAMFGGGVGAVVTVIGNEIINMTEIRSRQKKAWKEMRQKECTFVDSLQSVKGQSDFYSRQSFYGPLDPSDMNFDGITLRANRRGKEVLKMVCHIDTTKFDHLFLHSKFNLVVDTIVFHPYRSFLPNIRANRLEKPKLKKDYGIAKHDTLRKVDKSMFWATQDELDYWNTINQFSFDEYKEPTINIKMDVYSSWINELVQVYQDVKLGSFSVNIPISQKEVEDSVYTYYRKDAIANNRPTINMEGDCFVVPRSYMPVSANNPSWGTGEYKMKVILSEKCRYNPDSERSKNWHRDYKQLVRMQNHGKAPNEYLNDVFTTFRDNKNTIIKATYMPALNLGVEKLGIGSSGGKGKAGGMSGSAGTIGQAQGGASSTAGKPMGGNMPPTGGMPQGK